MAELYSRQVQPKQVKTGDFGPRARANLTAHARGRRRDSTSTPSPLRLGYANPVPQFTHPSLPHLHALPLCAHAGGHRRDSAPASPLRQATQAPLPRLHPRPACTPTHSPLCPDYPMATPPVYAPHPARTPSLFARMLGAQEDRGNACKGHASKVGRNPGGGAARKQKGRCTKAGVRKGEVHPVCVQGGGCASGVVRNPGGVAGKWKGGHTKAGV